MKTGKQQQQNFQVPRASVWSADSQDSEELTTPVPSQFYEKVCEADRQLCFIHILLLHLQFITTRHNATYYP